MPRLNDETPNPKGFGQFNKSGQPRTEQQQSANTSSSIEQNRQVAEVNLQGAVGLAGHTVHDTMHQLDRYVDDLTERAADAAMHIVHPSAVRSRFAGKLVGKLQSTPQADSKGFALGLVPQFSAPPALQLADFSHLFPTDAGSNNHQALPQSQPSNLDESTGN